MKTYKHLLEEISMLKIMVKVVELGKMVFGEVALG